MAEFKNGEWSNVRNLGPEINTSAYEGFPYIGIDGLLYFGEGFRQHVGGEGKGLVILILLGSQQSGGGQQSEVMGHGGGIEGEDQREFFAVTGDRVQRARLTARRPDGSDTTFRVTFSYGETLTFFVLPADAPTETVSIRDTRSGERYE